MCAIPGLVVFHCSFAWRSFSTVAVVCCRGGVRAGSSADYKGVFSRVYVRAYPGIPGVYYILLNDPKYDKEVWFGNDFVFFMTASFRVRAL